MTNTVIKPKDLDALERAARAATPGPWKESETDPPGDWCIHAKGTPWQLAYLHQSSQIDWPLEANAAFIAHANPAAILSLISENRALQERVEGAEKALAFYRDGFQFHPKRGPTGINHSEWKPKQSLLDDCGNVAVDYFAARTKAGEPHEQE